jgi:hypothetical protein
MKTDLGLMPRYALHRASVFTICGALACAFVTTHAAAKKDANVSARNAASPDAERMYVVKAAQGDTFLRMANRYFTNRKNWAPLAKHNPGMDPMRIPVGASVRMPVSAMRADVAGATVLAASGDARSDGAMLTAGQTVKEGNKLTTGEDGFVTIRLADGSTITVQSKSAAALERTRTLANTSVGESVVRLESGRLETAVAKQNAAARYEVRTPTSNMGVRGTVFRAGADSAGTKAISEVVEGAVGLASSRDTPAAGIALNAGFGSVVEAGKPPSAPVKLLDPPKLGVPTDAQTRNEVTVRVEPVAGAKAYRAQVAEDAGFQQLVAETVSTLANVTIGNLPDGVLKLRVRAIDAQGLEGLDASASVTIAARPFPPTPQSPVKGVIISGTEPELTWVADAAASKVRVQVAADAAFTKPLMDERTSGTRVAATGLAAGQYYWRMATIDATGKEGPFGAAETFSVRRDRLRVVPVLSSSAAQLTWRGEPGVSYQYQVSRRDSFREILQDRIITDSTITIEKLPKSTYFVRVRVVGTGSTPEAVKEPGEWSEPQAVEVFSGIL